MIINPRPIDSETVRKLEDWCACWDAWTPQDLSWLQTIARWSLDDIDTH